MGVFSRDFFGASGNLNKIRGWLQNPNASEESRIWNYGKYAYIQLSTNGTNNAGLCPGTSGVILGDRDYSGDNSGYTSAVQRSGERDIPQYPILESVRVNNDGATDVSDAALFDIDVTFKCYSISQFETYEAAYFKVGTGVDLSFGYKDLDGLGGSMTANVYNFGFTLDATGVYSCNMKLTGKNRFAAVLTVAQTLVGEGTTVTDDEGNELQSDTIIQELNNRFIESFPDFEESTSIQFSATADFVPDGEAVQSSDGLYAVANIQTKGGFDFTALGLRIDTDDMFIKYVSFEELVNVINHAHKGTGFSWGFGTEPGKIINEFASADPSVILLNGEMANYGDAGDDDVKNQLNTESSFSGFARDIYISIDAIGDIIESLTKKGQEDKDSKGDTGVNNFLRVICDVIKDLTGGLYQLTIFNKSFTSDSGQFLIVNERAEHAEGIKPNFNFSLHEIGSVVTSVNMSSNMDSDMAAAALVSNRSGEVPKGAFDNLYSECETPTTAPDVPEVTLDEIKSAKEAIGLGFSAERVKNFKELMRTYVTQKPKETGTDTGYRYMIDLSVNHYGVWGTEIGDTFSFSGVPSKYKGNGKYFCVGKMEHSFNGQGGWETSITGFLKIDAIVN